MGEGVGPQTAAATRRLIRPRSDVVELRQSGEREKTVVHSQN